MRQYSYLVLRELRLWRQEYPKYIVLMLLLPTIMTFFFASAINADVTHIPTAVFNQCSGEESRDLLAAFENSQYFDVMYLASSHKEITSLIESGQAKAGIIIPPDLASNIKHGRSSQVQVILEDSDLRNVNAAKSVAQLIGQIKST